jgi:tetratricopeptide (TPR) repeat protein
MTDKSKSNMTEFDKRVGQAWSLHIRRQYDGAIAQYQILLDEWGDHVMANFGIALSLKASGQKAKALEAFNKTKEYVANERIKNVDENSRLQMLERIVTQHIEDLSK